MGLIAHPSNHISEGTIGAAIEVHRLVGPGLLETAYRRCLSYELALRKIEHFCEVRLPIQYKDTSIENGYVLDLQVGDSLIVELKAVERLLPVHSAQLMTYLRLTGISAGLLINFNVPVLPQGIRRLLI